MDVDSHDSLFQPVDEPDMLRYNMDTEAEGHQNDALDSGSIDLTTVTIDQQLETPAVSILNAVNAYM